LLFKTADIRIAEMSETFRIKNLLFKFILISLSLLISCQSESNQNDSPPTKDDQTLSEIARINQVLTTGQPLTPADFESLKKIFEKYPKDSQVRNIYQSALVKREDWISLEKFIGEIPPNELSRSDQLNLAKVYLKLGRYQDLIDLMKPLAEATPNDTDFNSLLSFGYFYLGQNEEAARHLDLVWNKLLKEKRADEITTRGMIYFRQNNYPKAIEVLEKAIEINSQNATATNTLSRIYAAQNNAEKAEEFRKKTAEIHQKGEEFEAKAIQNVEMIYKLQTAWKEKNYSEVIELAQKILPESDEKNKAALYQYIAESYKALGKNVEAKAALAELQKLKNQ
jgi:tetratricopeptide (TPR) repeat protein